MKKLFLSLLAGCFSLLVLASGETETRPQPVAAPSSFRIASIDASDSVLIDLDNFVKVGNDIAVPVFILTDDTINSLDFSFKYDHANLLYDTMTVLASYIQPLFYYNAVDSTVRFTSFGTQPYATGATLLYVHFNLLAWQLTNLDIFSMNAYLNGDPCSFRLIGGIPSGLEETLPDFVRVYPNPVEGKKLTVEVQGAAEIRCTDMQGRLLGSYSVEAGQPLQILTEGWKSGVYTLTIHTHQYVFAHNIVIP